MWRLYGLKYHKNKTHKYDKEEWEGIKFMLSPKRVSIMWELYWWNYHNCMSYKHNMRLEKRIPNWKEIAAEHLEKYPDEPEESNYDDHD